ncbi:hypothetical protein CHCC14809_0869 [Bacillus licheniformis]|jgi:hypothetical protein|uniref:Uncharacterized protein n=1 Tax=Bacillus licheniformis TaxID=1402 RepID=A0A8B5YI53_BACLI|nr:hypothetical protein B4091_3563 [Bacillus licheniformis]TWN15613.1 hypothetical protein CHCC14564_0178 [Bacillus licheniformis LMG 17339]KYC93372.1 hypothetical protein B4164_3254 [Bacillus licheniformis]OLF86134.1 hypothetical protein B4094_4598 [Bacillus licheniformis]OLG09920.1 hypothetical protein B4124_0564 [Bacillus licheniformis]
MEAAGCMGIPSLKTAAYGRKREILSKTLKNQIVERIGFR